MYEIMRARQRHHKRSDKHTSSSFLRMPSEDEVEPFGPLSLCLETRLPGEDFRRPFPRAVDLVLLVLEGRLRVESEDSIEEIEPFELSLLPLQSDAGLYFRNVGDGPCRFLEIGFEPDEEAGPAAPFRSAFQPKGPEAVLLPIVSGQGHEGALPIPQDCALYWSRLRPGDNVIFETTLDRRVFALLLDGAVRTEEDRLIALDSLYAYRETKIPFSAKQMSRLILMDLA